MLNGPRSLSCVRPTNTQVYRAVKVVATRPKSICKHAACGALIDAPGYCGRHKKEAVGWNQTSTQTTSERGYGADWRRLRVVILRRDNGLCQPCKAAGRLTVATEVDHIINKAIGGTDAPVNLQSICNDCHKVKTAAERRSGLRS